MLSKPLFLLAACVLTSTASAAELATVHGEISSGTSGILVQGTIVNSSKACAPFLKREARDGKLHGAAIAEKNASIPSCNYAVITLDLEGSSFCQDQGGMEVYFPPKVVSVRCLGLE